MTKPKTDIWMPIYVGDYLSDTMHLTTEQHGAYFLLMLAYWKNRGPLQENRLKHIVSIDDDSWTIVGEFFDNKIIPGKWVHKRIESELKKASVRKQAAENRGKKGMESRWGKQNKDSSTNSSTIVEGIVGDNTSPSPSYIKKKDIYSAEAPFNNIPYKKIIDYLNQQANTHFKHTTKATQNFIKARWNENFKFDAFKYVIDVKCSQWLTDPKMVSYLRPQTLFGTKFESYLNEVIHA